MRRHIPKAVKDMVLHMMNDEALTDKLIHYYTGISMCSLKRLRQTYCEMGDSVQTPVCNGRPRILDSLETAVSSTLLSRPSFGNRFTYTCFAHVSSLPLVTTAVE